MGASLPREPPNGSERAVAAVTPHVGPRPGGLDASQERRFPPARWHLVMGLTITVVALFYVFVVPLGLPYDEPAHWANVLYISHHGTLPVLGRDAAYEAQMGPVAYYLYLVPLGIARLLRLGDHAGLYGARLLGVPLLVALYLLVIRVVRISLPCVRPTVIAAAAAIATLNPMLVTMGTSVQNDLLALVLGAAALLMALTPGGTRHALLIGVLTGLAVLTKLTAWPVAPVIVGILLLRREPWQAALVTGAALAVSGWWFVRNVILYGDLTGQRGVATVGYDFHRYELQGLGGVGHITSQVVTYLWLPNEYLRNTISAPAVLKVLVVLTTAAIIVLAALHWRDAPRPGPVATVSTLALGAWLITYLAVQAVAPRIAYCALLGWAAVIALALIRVPTRMLLVGAVVLLLGLHAWTLFAVTGVNPPAFLL